MGIVQSTVLKGERLFIIIMKISATIHQLILISGFIVHKIQANENDQVVIEHDFLIRPLASPQGNFSSQCMSNYTSQCKILNGDDGQWIGELVSSVHMLKVFIFCN